MRIMHSLHSLIRLKLMLADQEVRILQEHYQMQRDQALVRSLPSQQSGFNPQTARGVNQRQRKSRGRGRGYQGTQQSQGFNDYYQDFHQSYRGRAPHRGRGNFRAQSRRGQNQPFSESQSKPKQD